VDPVLVYTPGDNEWSDCHKPGEGGNVKDASGAFVDYENGDPLKNLDLVRSIFFPEPGKTLGNGHLEVESQGASYVENVAWQRKGVRFVTVNVPGGSNNDADPWYGASITRRQTAGTRTSTARTTRSRRPRPARQRARSRWSG
jgi:hypothetical protein